MNQKRQRINPGRRTGFARRKTVAVAVAACFSTGVALANPVNPTVVHGTATFATAGNILNITNSQNAVINWGSFSIGVNELTKFVQPSALSAVLNRVTGQDPSAILGALQSNGRVFLINPNGITFGAGAQIDVAGLVASTLKLSDDDFLNNRLRFTDGAVAGNVVNQGSITGGSVYLIGNAVTNNGIITSPQGEAILAAGNSVELVNPGMPNLRVEIVAPDNAARNLGTIAAEAGRIGIYAGLINHSGAIRADTAEVGRNGEILLKASKNITLEPGSVISASGAPGGVHDGGTVRIVADDTLDMQRGSAVRVDGGVDGGDGGFLELSGKQKIALNGEYTGRALKTGYRHGSLLIDPLNINVVAANAVIADIAAGTNPFKVAVSPDGSRLYVTNFGSGNVSVIDTATNTVIATVTVGGNAQGVAVTPDGTHVYVTSEGNNVVTVISAATNSVVSPGPIAVGAGPKGIAFTPDGMRAYVTNFQSNTVTVLDTSNVASPWVLTTVGVGGNPHGVAVSPLGGANAKVYVANRSTDSVSVINVADNAVTSIAMAAGAGPVELAVSPDGARVYVANQFNNTVSVISTADNTVTSFAAGGTGPHGVAFTADGGRVYITNNGSATVSVYATTGNGLIGTVSVGVAPLGVTIGSDPGRAYVASTTVPVIAVAQASTLGGVIAAGDSPGATLDIAPASLFGAWSSTLLAATNDINVLSTVNYTGATDHSLTFAANNTIAVASGVEIKATGAGKLAVTLNSDANADGAGAIVMNGGSKIISNGGNILLGGGAGAGGFAVGEGSNGDGIVLNNTVVDSGAGTITMRGTGMSASASERGINILGGSIVRSTSGAIALTGIGGAGTSDNYGIRVNGAGSRVSTVSGSITMTGTGAGTTINNHGIALEAGGMVEATGSGNLSLIGQGGAGTNQNHGILINTGTVNSTSGSILVNGTGGAGSGMNNFGVFVSSGTVQAGGNANLTFIGQGGNGGTLENYGVLFSNATVGSAGGTISVTGTGGNGSGDTNLGVFVNNGSIQTTGSGGIALSGLAGAGVNGNTGVTVGTGAIISAADGAIQISGTGAGSGAGTNAGVLLSASSVTATGAQTIEISGSAAGAAPGVNVLGGTLGGASHSGDLIVRARGDDGINLAGTVNGTGRLFLEPFDAPTTIGLGGGIGTFNLSSSELGQIQNGFSLITIGHSAGTGLINVGSHTFGDPVIIRNTGAGSAGIVTSGTLAAGVNDLNLLSAGLVNVIQGTISGANIGINAGSLMVQPGVSAISSSLVNATGNLSVNANTVQVRGSDTSASLTAKLQAGGTVMINAGAVSIEGGNANNASAAIDPTGVMLNVNSLSLTGGAGIDSYALIQSPSGDIIMTAGGAVTLQPGTGSNANAAIVADIGTVTIQSAQCVGCTVLATNPVSPPSLLASGIYGGAGISLLLLPSVTEDTITAPTQILIVAMGESVAPPEPEKDKDIFRDAEDEKKKDAPVCR